MRARTRSAGSRIWLGSGFNDSLTGDANANTLTGGAGDDTLNPGANAGGTVDLLDGGLGSDTASFAGNASGVTATLNGASDGTATIAGLAIATLRSIENLTGSANADILTGDANANAIEGGLGNDTLDGGLGVDTLVFTGSTAVTVNLATLTAQNTGWGSDTITGFENVRTGSGADNITGDGNDNIFFDGGGNDTYNGAGGIGHGRLFRRHLDGHGQPQHRHGPEYRDLRRHRHDHQHGKRGRCGGLRQHADRQHHWPTG